MSIYRGRIFLLLGLIFAGLALGLKTQWFSPGYAVQSAAQEAAQVMDDLVQNNLAIDDGQVVHFKHGVAPIIEATFDKSTRDLSVGCSGEGKRFMFVDRSSDGTIDKKDLAYLQPGTNFTALFVAPDQYDQGQLEQLAMECRNKFVATARQMISDKNTQ
ncbi:MAG: hypothetical protein R3B41_03840 [Candidatus Doudnabacteria bacterium]